MKVLIWIGCMILNYVLQTIARAVVSCIPVTDDSSAVLIGLLNGVLAAASIGLCIWLAIKLCKKLDWYQVMKKASEAGMTVSEYGKHGLSQEFLDELDKISHTLPYEQVKPKFKSFVRSGKMTKEQCIILLEEYCNNKY